jgi:5'-nucleotidase
VFLQAQLKDRQVRISIGLFLNDRSRERQYDDKVRKNCQLNLNIVSFAIRDIAAQEKKAVLGTSASTGRDPARPLPGRPMPTCAEVEAELAQYNLETFEFINENAESVQLIIQALKDMGKDVQAQELQAMAKDNGVRAGPLKTCLATVAMIDGKKVIILSNAYPSFSTPFEQALSLAHEIDSVLEGTSHEKNTQSEEQAFVYLIAGILKNKNKEEVEAQLKTILQNMLVFKGSERSQGDCVWIASASERKQAIARQAVPDGVKVFELKPGHTDETIVQGVDLEIALEALSFSKLYYALSRSDKAVSDGIFLSGDFIFEREGQAQGKVETKEEAKKVYEEFVASPTHGMAGFVLAQLKDGSFEHVVWAHEDAYLALRRQRELICGTDRGWSLTEENTVGKVHDIYIERGVYQDKAAGIGVQDEMFWPLVRCIYGDPFVIRGLPMARLHQELAVLLGSTASLDWDEIDAGIWGKIPRNPKLKLLSEARSQGSVKFLIAIAMDNFVAGDIRTTAWAVRKAFDAAHQSLKEEETKELDKLCGEAGETYSLRRVSSTEFLRKSRFLENLLIDLNDLVDEDKNDIYHQQKEALWLAGKTRAARLDKEILFNHDDPQVVLAEAVKVILSANEEDFGFRPDARHLMPVTQEEIASGLKDFDQQVLENPEKKVVGIALNNVGEEFLGAAALAYQLQQAGKRVIFYVYPRAHMQYDLTMQDRSKAEQFVRDALNGVAGWDGTKINAMISQWGDFTPFQVKKEDLRRNFEKLDSDREIDALVVLGEDAAEDVRMYLIDHPGTKDQSVPFRYSIFILRARKNLTGPCVLARQSHLFASRESDYEAVYYRALNEFKPAVLAEIAGRLPERHTFAGGVETMASYLGKSVGTDKLGLFISKFEQEPALACAVLASWLDKGKTDKAPDPDLDSSETGQSVPVNAAHLSLGDYKKDVEHWLTRMMRVMRAGKTFSVNAGGLSRNIYFASTSDEQKTVGLKSLISRDSLLKAFDAKKDLSELKKLEDVLEANASQLFGINTKSPVGMAMAMAFMKAAVMAVKMESGFVVARQTVVACGKTSGEYRTYLPQELSRLIQPDAELMVYTAACVICMPKDRDDKGADQTTVDLRYSFGLVKFAGQEIDPKSEDMKFVFHDLPGIEEELRSLIARSDKNIAFKKLKTFLIHKFNFRKGRTPQGDYLTWLRWDPAEEKSDKGKANHAPLVRALVKKIYGDPYAVIGLPLEELKDYFSAHEIQTKEIQKELFPGKITFMPFGRTEDLIKFLTKHKENLDGISELLSDLPTFHLDLKEQIRLNTRLLVMRVKIFQRQRRMYDAVKTIEEIHGLLARLCAANGSVKELFGIEPELLEKEIQSLYELTIHGKSFDPNVWNYDGVDIVEQTRVFRHLDIVTALLFGWADHKPVLRDLKVVTKELSAFNEDWSATFYEADPWAFEKIRKNQGALEHFSKALGEMRVDDFRKELITQPRASTDKERGYNFLANEFNEVMSVEGLCDVLTHAGVMSSGRTMLSLNALLENKKLYLCPAMTKRTPEIRDLIRRQEREEEIDVVQLNRLLFEINFSEHTPKRLLTWGDKFYQVSVGLLEGMAREDFLADVGGIVRGVPVALVDDREVFLRDVLKNAYKLDRKSVGIFLNNAGDETVLAIFFAYLLLNYGFKVTLYTSLLPSINSDVTTDEIYFLIPYMDTILRKAEAKAGLVDYYAQEKLVIQPFEANYTDEEEMRDRMVEEMNRHDVSLSLGELWYGYLVGLGKEPSMEPFNRDFDYSWSHDPEGKRFTRGRPVLAKDSSVIAVFVHKNAQQHLEHRNLRRKDGVKVLKEEESDALPYDRTSYNAYLYQLFRGGDWYHVRRQYNVNMGLTLADLVARPEVLEALKNNIKDALSFYLSVPENKKRFLIRPVEVSSRRVEWIYKTPLRRMRVVLESEGRKKVVLKIDIAINFDPLRRELPAANFGGRIAEIPTHRMKIPGLVVSHVRCGAVQAAQAIAMQTVVAIADPLKQYRFARIVMDDKDNIKSGLVGDERVSSKSRFVPDYYAFDISCASSLGRKLVAYLNGGATRRIFVKSEKQFIGSRRLVWLSPAYVVDGENGPVLRVIVKNPGKRVWLGRFLGADTATAQVTSLGMNGVAYGIKWAQGNPQVTELNDFQESFAKALPGVNKMPHIFSAPIDPYTHATMRAVFHKYGKCPVVFTDLIRTANIFDQNFPKDAYWEDVEFSGGLSRMNFVTGMATVVQLAFPHKTPVKDAFFAPGTEIIDWEKTILFAQTAAALAKTMGMSGVDINTGSPALADQKGGAYLNDRIVIACPDGELRPFVSAQTVNRSLRTEESVRMEQLCKISIPLKNFEFCKSCQEEYKSALIQQFMADVDKHFIELTGAEVAHVKDYVNGRFDQALKAEKNEYILTRIVRELKEATGEDFPICVKTRLVTVTDKDKDMITATREFLTQIMSVQPRWIVVHMRTKEEGYKSGKAKERWDKLAEILKGIDEAARVPVYVNGEFVKVADIKRFKDDKYDEGISGIMVAMASLTNPFILEDMALAWGKNKIKEHAREEYFELMQEYVDLSGKEFNGRLNPDKAALGLQSFLGIFNDPDFWGKAGADIKENGKGVGRSLMTEFQPVIFAAKEAIKAVRPESNGMPGEFEAELKEIISVVAIILEDAFKVREKGLKEVRAVVEAGVKKFDEYYYFPDEEMKKEVFAGFLRMKVEQCHLHSKICNDCGGCSKARSATLTIAVCRDAAVYLKRLNGDAGASQYADAGSSVAQAFEQWYLADKGPQAPPLGAEEFESMFKNEPIAYVVDGKIEQHPAFLFLTPAVQEFVLTHENVHQKYPVISDEMEICAIHVLPALVVGVSSSALYDLRESDAIRKEQGEELWRQYEREHEDVPLKPGMLFSFVKRLLVLNDMFPGAVKVVLFSRHDVDTGKRIVNSNKGHGLRINQLAFTHRRSPVKYIKSYKTSVYFSTDEEIVVEALSMKCPAGLVLPGTVMDDPDDKEFRLVYDFDGIIADNEADELWDSDGPEAVYAHEALNVALPHQSGPMRDFFVGMAAIQERDHRRIYLDEKLDPALRVSIVTKRGAQNMARVVTTLRSLGVIIDDVFFLDGEEKTPVIEQINPHMVIDDQKQNLLPISDKTLRVHVPFNGEHKKIQNAVPFLMLGLVGGSVGIKVAALFILLAGLVWLIRQIQKGRFNRMASGINGMFSSVRSFRRALKMTARPALFIKFPFLRQLKQESVDNILPFSPLSRRRYFDHVAAALSIFSRRMKQGDLSAQDIEDARCQQIDLVEAVLTALFSSKLGFVGFDRAGNIKPEYSAILKKKAGWTLDRENLIIATTASFLMLPGMETFRKQTLSELKQVYLSAELAVTRVMRDPEHESMARLIEFLVWYANAYVELLGYGILKDQTPLKTFINDLRAVSAKTGLPQKILLKALYAAALSNSFLKAGGKTALLNPYIQEQILRINEMLESNQAVPSDKLAQLLDAEFFRDVRILRQEADADFKEGIRILLGKGVSIEGIRRLIEVRKLASWAHRGQMRSKIYLINDVKKHAYYEEHICGAFLKAVRMGFTDINRLTYTLLHDIVEDTRIPLNILRAFIGARGIYVLKLLDKKRIKATDTKLQHYALYTTSLVVRGGLDAEVPKTGDILDNSETLGERPVEKRKYDLEKHRHVILPIMMEFSALSRDEKAAFLDELDADLDLLLLQDTDKAQIVDQLQRFKKAIIRYRELIFQEKKSDWMVLAKGIHRYMDRGYTVYKGRRTALYIRIFSRKMLVPYVLGRYLVANIVPYLLLSRLMKEYQAVFIAEPLAGIKYEGRSIVLHVRIIAGILFGLLQQSLLRKFDNRQPSSLGKTLDPLIGREAAVRFRRTAERMPGIVKDLSVWSVFQDLRPMRSEVQPIRRITVARGRPGAAGRPFLPLRLFAPYVLFPFDLALPAQNVGRRESFSMPFSSTLPDAGSPQGWPHELMLPVSLDLSRPFAFSPAVLPESADHVQRPLLLNRVSQSMPYDHIASSALWPLREYFPVTINSRSNMMPFGRTPGQPSLKAVPVKIELIDPSDVPSRFVRPEAVRRTFDRSEGPQRALRRMPVKVETGLMSGVARTGVRGDQGQDDLSDSYRATGRMRSGLLRFEVRNRADRALGLEGILSDRNVPAELQAVFDRQRAAVSLTLQRYRDELHAGMDLSQGATVFEKIKFFGLQQRRALKMRDDKYAAQKFLFLRDLETVAFFHERIAAALLQENVSENLLDTGEVLERMDARVQDHFWPALTGILEQSLMEANDFLFFNIRTRSVKIRELLAAIQLTFMMAAMWLVFGSDKFVIRFRSRRFARTLRSRGGSTMG